MNENKLHLSLDTDKNLIPRDVPSQRILEMLIRAPLAVDQGSRMPLNLALVLDRSGSMSGEKLEYVKQAAGHVLGLLQEQDSVALIAYDDEIKLLSPSQRVTASNRAELQSRVAQIRPGGSTNLGGGWLAGCQEAAAAAQKNSINRTLLLTDGLANAGITDIEALSTHARELAKRGVSTSTFGVGLGFNEHLLEAMSNLGGGNFYYIETPAEIPGLFQREFKELAAVTAGEVEINIDFPARMSLQVLGGWAVEFSKGRARISLGNLFSGQSSEIYIRLLTPPAEGPEDLKMKVTLTAKDEAGQRAEASAELTFHYAEMQAVEATEQKREVLQRFAVIDLAETATKALKLEREGQRLQANQLIQHSIAEHFAVAAPGAVAKYEQLSRQVMDGMDESARKHEHYNSYKDKRQRG